MRMHRQRAAQNGRLWVTFFATKYCDLFCDQGGGGGGGGSGPDPPRPLYPSLADTRHTERCVCFHLSCMSFVWQDTSLFMCSQNVTHFWGQ